MYFTIRIYVKLIGKGRGGDDANATHVITSHLPLLRAPPSDRGKVHQLYYTVVDSFTCIFMFVCTRYSSQYTREMNIYEHTDHVERNTNRVPLDTRRRGSLRVLAACGLFAGCSFR